MNDEEATKINSLKKDWPNEFDPIIHAISLQNHSELHVKCRGCILLKIKCIKDLPILE
jgi:hypothetical protein